MKRPFIFAIALLVITSSALAIPFSPAQLKLIAPPVVEYMFDGTTAQIPVTVSGTPAGVFFLVFTEGQASSIQNVRNGYLGWHYVNNIDTCVYASTPFEFTQGNHTINWEGKNQDGVTVPAGSYTYYLWGWDNIGTKKPVTTQNIYPMRGGYIEERDADGMPLAQPIYMRSLNKWVLGGDPEDPSLLETTRVVLPENYGLRERIAFQPGDYSNFYAQIHNTESGYLGIWKYQWVPGGESVLDTSWGDDGVLLPVQALGTYTNNWFSGVVTDRQYLYATICRREEPIVNFYVANFDGELVKTIDMSEWWVNQQELNAGGQLTGGPNDIMVRNQYVFLNAHTSCLESMVNPSAGLDDEEAFWVWHNGNGDFVGDHNFEPNAQRPWVCFDYNVAPYTYTITSDSNYFTMTPSYDMGAVSFALYAPDGTGLGYHAYSGETSDIKWGNFICDNGSAYDGIYTDNNSTGGEGAKTGVWYVGHDSIKGTITNQVGVADAAPAAFKVAQNVPNPFNPTTTISFTLARAGRTTVEVYNVAGQKVDTLVNSSLKAGSHSVTWNAASFSAGVYFYTVKSGSFSKTTKMTLLK